MKTIFASIWGFLSYVGKRIYLGMKSGRWHKEERKRLRRRLIETIEELQTQIARGENEEGDEETKRLREELLEVLRQQEANEAQEVPDEEEAERLHNRLTEVIREKTAHERKSKYKEKAK